MSDPRKRQSESEKEDERTSKVTPTTSGRGRGSRHMPSRAQAEATFGGHLDIMSRIRQENQAPTPGGIPTATRAPVAGEQSAPSGPAPMSTPTPTAAAAAAAQLEEIRTRRMDLYGRRPDEVGSGSGGNGAGPSGHAARPSGEGGATTTGRRSGRVGGGDDDDIIITGGTGRLSLNLRHPPDPWQRSFRRIYARNSDYRSVGLTLGHSLKSQGQVDAQLTRVNQELDRLRIRQSVAATDLKRDRRAIAVADDRVTRAEERIRKLKSELDEALREETMAKEEVEAERRTVNDAEKEVGRLGKEIGMKEEE